jgi:predicted nucleic acid-binding protein
VIAVDTNVLVAAHRREPREHPAAHAGMRDLAEGSEPWAIPWPCVFEFFSVVTNPRIWKDAASTPEQAWLQLEAC